MQLIEEVASDEIIEQALLWLCLKRKEHYYWLSHLERLLHEYLNCMCVVYAKPNL